MDEKTKHTPGPWTAIKARTQFHVRGARGEVVVSVGMPSRGGAQERSANAKLIAASPALLAACEALIHTDDLQKAIDLARAALSQVEG